MTYELGAHDTLPLRVLLDEAVRQARRHFRRLYPPIAIPLALASATLPLAQLSMVRTMSTAGKAGPNPLELMQGFAVFFVVIFVWVIGYLFAHGALVCGVLDAVSGREVRMGRAWRQMLRPRLLGTLLLSGLAVGLGLVLCVLPGLYVGLLLTFTLPVMLEEGLFGVRALRRSAALARHNPQRKFDADPRVKVFLIYFVGALLGYVVSMVVQLPFVVLQQVMMFREVASGHRPDPAAMMTRMAWLQVPGQMLGMLTHTAIQLYTTFGLCLLFLDVKRRREGLDLETAVARLVESRFGRASTGAAAGEPSPEGEGLG